MMRNETTQFTTRLRACFINKYTPILALSLFISESALAFTKPTAGDTGYAMYDLIVVNGIQGAIGFVAGAWILIQAGQQIKESVWKAGLGAVGGVGLMKAETIMEGVGVTLQSFA